MIEIVIENGVSEKIIIETLSRIGIANKKTKELFPSVYLYKYENKCYLAHFKEILSNRENGFDNLTDEDLQRRDNIINCLYNWELIDLELEDIIPNNMNVFILPFAKKKEWKIKHKIRIQY